MLNAIPGLSPDVVAYSAAGKVTAKDYEDHIVPAIERVLAAGDRPRFLYVLGPDFEGFELRAMFADAKVGISHLSDFERIAVVTDHDWIENSVRAVGVFVPCPVRVFEDDELAEAKAWIDERGGDALELTVARDGDRALVHARLRGVLDRAAEDRLVTAAKEGIGDATAVRVLIEATGFHGWRELRALWQHLRFVVGVRAKLDRVAVVGEAKWQERLVSTAKHVGRVDARFFDADDLDDALEWVRG